MAAHDLHRPTLPQTMATGASDARALNLDTLRITCGRGKRFPESARAAGGHQRSHLGSPPRNPLGIGPLARRQSRLLQSSDSQATIRSHAGVGRVPPVGRRVRRAVFRPFARHPATCPATRPALEWGFRPARRCGIGLFLPTVGRRGAAPTQTLSEARRSDPANTATGR